MQATSTAPVTVTDLYTSRLILAAESSQCISEAGHHFQKLRSLSDLPLDLVIQGKNKEAYV